MVVRTCALGRLAMEAVVAGPARGDGPHKHPVSNLVALDTRTQLMDDADRLVPEHPARRYRPLTLEDVHVGAANRGHRDAPIASPGPAVGISTDSSRKSLTPRKTTTCIGSELVPLARTLSLLVVVAMGCLLSSRLGATKSWSEYGPGRGGRTRPRGLEAGDLVPVGARSAVIAQRGCQWTAHPWQLRWLSAPTMAPGISCGDGTASAVAKALQAPQDVPKPPQARFQSSAKPLPLIEDMALEATS